MGIMSKIAFLPRVITCAGGAIIHQTERDLFAYDSWHFAPARGAGDFIYVSGIIVTRVPERVPRPETFSDSLRGAFRELGQQLQAYKSSFKEVVMLTTCHDWSAPEFSGDTKAQEKAFQTVKNEFISEPHPAWTAVGTTGFVKEDGILELQAVAYSPEV
jgi:enamine deaminase RidA (YjgF/YER057c/UK114 family)